MTQTVDPLSAPGSTRRVAPSAEASVRLAFVGILEAPIESDHPLLGEQIEVRGWALAEQIVDRVAAGFEPSPTTDLQVGLARADVVEAFADWPNANRSGFTGWLDIAGLPAGERTLFVSARAGEKVVHEWRRAVRLSGIDEVYRQWRASMDRPLHANAPASPAGGDTGRAAIATWIVWSTNAADADLAEATAAVIRRDGRGLWDVVVVDLVDDPTPPRLATPYIGVLRAGDRLAPNAAEVLSAGLRASAAPDLIYADHDHLDPDGRCADPVFKPGWSPLLRFHPDVVSRGWLVRRELFGDDPWPLLRACCGVAAGLPATVAAHCRSAWHVALPLVSLQRASRQHVQGGAARPSAALPAGKVSVVIPSRLADLDLMTRCLDALRHGAGGAELEIVVALNNLHDIAEADALAFLRRWSAVTLHVEGRFNWSRLNNQAARTARGELLLFLNDDVEPIAADWLRAMLGLAEDPGLGAIGAVLRYPDGRIQHAGVYINGGERPECRHSFRHCSGLEPRVRRWLSHDRMQTAVTGACLLTPRSAFDLVGGFDEALPVVFNDVDYCLRLRDRGLLSAVAAGAELRHHEGLSRGGIAEEKDRQYFCARWAAWLPAVDPYSHPGLIHDRDDWMFDPLRLPLVESSPS